MGKTFGFFEISILEHLQFRIDRTAQKMDSESIGVGYGDSSLIQTLHPSIRVSAIVRFRSREIAPVTELQYPPDSSSVFDHGGLFLHRFRCTRRKGIVVPRSGTHGRQPGLPRLLGPHVLKEYGLGLMKPSPSSYDAFNSKDKRTAFRSPTFV